MPTSAEFEEWASKLSSRDATTRNLAAAQLAHNVGPDQVGLVPLLAKSLHQGASKMIQKNCAVALGNIGAPAARVLPELENALNYDYWPLKAAVLDAIRAVDVEETIPVSTLIAAIEKTVKHDASEVYRGFATFKLGQFGTKSSLAVPTLIEALSSPSKWTRLSAVIALDQIGPGASAAIPQLKAARNDAFEKVREAAVKAIEMIAPSESIDGLGPLEKIGP